MTRKVAAPRKLKVARTKKVVSETSAAPQPPVAPTPKVKKSRGLDEGQQREVLAILSVGGSRSTAAGYVKRAVIAIRRMAERDPLFHKRLRHAESSHEILQLKNINAAANDVRYWRAAAWALERRYPDRYGVRHPKVITANEAASMLALFAAIVIEEVAELPLRLKIERRLDQLAATLHDTKQKKPKTDET